MSVSMTWPRSVPTTSASPGKAYQVRQVLDAIARLEAEKNEEGDDGA